VVILDTAVMVGGGISSLFWGWAADRVGSRPVLMPAALLSLLVPIGWLLLPRQTSHAVVWCGGLYFAYGVASNGIAIGAGRLLFNSVAPREKSTAYMAIFYASLGLTGGIAPLLAGALLSAAAGRRIGIGSYTADGFGLLFLLALALLALGWWLYGRVKPDDQYTTRGVMKKLLKPALADTLVWTRERAESNLPWNR
jgi:MFS family permease